MLAAGAAMHGQDLTLPPAGEEPASKNAWVPDLLYGIIDSPNSGALNALYDAAFAAGRPIVPQLEAALRDDRTAEFAAQSLAFIGGDQAMKALAGLVHDPRDLDLRRFYYGALGGFDDPQSNGILLNVIRNANHEADRTVTEAAIVALTVRSDQNLMAPLQQAEAKLTDPVIQDDVTNVISIIQGHVRYLSAAHLQNSADSIEAAVHTYFIPAMQASLAAAAGRSPASHAGATRPARAAKFKIRHVEYNPDKSRALARVTLEASAAAAHYWIVLQKQARGWTIETAWLEEEGNIKN
jgi:hypothetical protein